MIRRELIALTATINLNFHTNQVRRSDTEQRLNDTIESLKSWLVFAKKTSRDLVLIENSDSLAFLRERIDFDLTGVEFFQMSNNIDSAEQGISAGEFQMLRYLVENKNLDKYSFVWKAPGRNFCPNAFRVLVVENGTQIVASRNSLPAHFASSRLFGMTPLLWHSFVSRHVLFTLDKNKIRNNTFSSMEHYLTSFILEQEAKGKIQRDFPRIPRFTGYSGSTNKVIDNRKRRILILILNPFRKLFLKGLLGNTP